MVYGMASAVHHAGGHQLASELRNKAVKHENKICAFTAFVLFVETMDKALHSKAEVAETYDLLANKKNSLVLASIRGGDGKEDHCIAVYGRWIFDSNFPRALMLTKESLDLCCSSDDESTHYIGCSQVVSFPCIYMVK